MKRSAPPPTPPSTVKKQLIPSLIQWNVLEPVDDEKINSLVVQKLRAIFRSSRPFQDCHPISRRLVPHVFESTLFYVSPICDGERFFLLLLHLGAEDVQPAVFCLSENGKLFKLIEAEVLLGFCVHQGGDTVLDGSFCFNIKTQGKSTNK